MMSEKWFGSTYEGVGSTSTDLLLKTRGLVKILVEKKFIDLLKNGKLNIPSIFHIVNSLDDITSEGIYLYNDNLYIRINNLTIPLSQESSFNYEIITGVEGEISTKAYDTSEPTPIEIPNGIIGHKYLKLKYLETPIYIDTRSNSYSSGKGIDISNQNIISIKIDEESEEFLSIGESGLKLSGINKLFNLYYTKEEIDTAIENALNNLDMALVGGTGKMITTISQTDGVVSATAIDAKASNIAVNNTNFSNTNVENALNTLYNRSSITVDETSGTGDILKSYTIKLNGTTIGTINIPKDLVVQSGSVVSGTWNGSTFTESASGTDTALKLVIANLTNPIYINIALLVDIYTAGNGIDVSNTNSISVKLDDTTEGFLTVGANGLKLSGVQNAIDLKIGNITVNSVNGTVSGGVASLTLKTNNIKLNTGVSSGTFSALTTSDTITTALGKLYGGIITNQANITKNAVSNSDSSITITPGTSSTDIKVNIIDCGTYTI